MADQIPDLFDLEVPKDIEDIKNIADNITANFRFVVDGKSMSKDDQWHCCELSFDGFEPVPIQSDKSRILITNEKINEYLKTIKTRGEFQKTFRKWMMASVFINHYQPDDVVKYKEMLRWKAIHSLPADFKPFQNCVHVIGVTYRFLPLKSWTKKILAELDNGAMIYKTTNPDLDNLGKGVFDSLKGVVYKDDSLICHKSGISKVYSHVNGITIKMVGT